MASEKSQHHCQNENLAKTKVNLLKCISNATEERRRQYTKQSSQVNTAMPYTSTPIPGRKRDASTTSTLSHALDMPKLANRISAPRRDHRQIEAIPPHQDTLQDAVEIHWRSHPIQHLDSPNQNLYTVTTSTPLSTRLPTPSTPSTFRFDDSGNSVDVGNVKFDMLDIASSYRAQLASGVNVLLEPFSETKGSSSTQQTRRTRQHATTSDHTSPLLHDVSFFADEMMSSSSDIGSSRKSHSSLDTIESSQVQRSSASFVSDDESRRARQEKQDQFDQVSDALYTLKTFLHQREGIMTPRKDLNPFQDIRDHDPIPSLSLQSPYTNIKASAWPRLDSRYALQDQLQSPMTAKQSLAAPCLDLVLLDVALQS